MKTTLDTGECSDLFADHRGLLQIINAQQLALNEQLSEEMQLLAQLEKQQRRHYRTSLDLQASIDRLCQGCQAHAPTGQTRNRPNVDSNTFTPKQQFQATCSEEPMQPEVDMGTDNLNSQLDSSTSAVNAKRQTRTSMKDNSANGMRKGDVSTLSVFPCPSSEAVPKRKDVTKSTEFADEDNEALELGQRGVCERVITSVQFEFIFGALICLNTVMTAAQLQHQGLETGYNLSYENVGKPSDATVFFSSIDIIFALLFLSEIVVKILILRMKFFKSAWNCMDAATVALGTVDTFKLLNLGINPTMVRLLRLSKLTRYMKLLKTATWLDVLRLIIKSIIGSFSTVFWSLLLLFAVQGLVGMLLGQILLDFMNDETISKATRKDVYKHWGTLPRILCTMFEITFVSANTPSIRALMDGIDVGWGTFFMIYRLCINFVLLSVIRGVIVKQTFKVAEQDKECQLRKTLKANSDYRQKLRKVFFNVDSSGDGTIQVEELRNFLLDPNAQQVLKALDLDYHAGDANELFDRLNSDGDGGIDFQEMMMGLHKLKGAAKSSDVQLVLTRLDHVHKAIVQALAENKATIPTALAVRPNTKLKL